MHNNKETISKNLVAWYENHARQLPWRETKDPYRIWISEIILQQTTVDQGLPYYHKFIAAFPDIQSLSAASQDEVMKIWQGLGYYSRARNLHASSKYIVEELDGLFPDSYDKLLKMKGVGPYTAAAISSFCFNENHVVVDGNVIRFISRLYGIKDDVQKNSTIKRIRELAQGLINFAEPAVFNQAIMEFGALQCTAQNPACSKCPFVSSCQANLKDLVSGIPLKKKKIKKKNRFFYYGIFIDADSNTLIKKRDENDIWAGLYEFPYIENSTAFVRSPKASDFGISFETTEKNISPVVKHVLTHQVIYARFAIFISKTPFQKPFLPFTKVGFRELEGYAFPRLIDLYLNDLSLTLF